MNLENANNNFEHVKDEKKWTDENYLKYETNSKCKTYLKNDNDLLNKKNLEDDKKVKYEKKFKDEKSLKNEKYGNNIKDENQKMTEKSQKKNEIAYFSVFLVFYFHFAGVYGAYLCFTKTKWRTLIFVYFVFLLSAIGVVVGTHKLWSHRSFKARLPLEVFLMLCQSMAFQFTVFTWVRDHRLHHKYSDTDADPHNSNRGFFFSHIGWLMVRRHPEVKRRGAGVNMEDIRSNPVLAFQKRHSKWLLPTAAFIIPTLIPALFWSEDISTSWHLNQLRFIINLNLACTVNSISHMWGYRPYDSGLKACQSWPIILLTYGEGFHNYHHAFPFDYRASEKGNYRVNFMSMFVDVCAKVGLAYDLKVASEEAVRSRMERTGDGSDLWCRNKVM